MIPTHFREDLVERILLALNRQDFDMSLVEIIIVPTPNDGTKALVDQLQSEITCKVILSQVPGDESGRDVSAKRQHGAQVAQGTWLAFLDNDMVPEPHWLKEASLFFDQEEVAGIEGKTLIPAVDKPTLTYKGLQRVVEPGGYQSCNIFYRKTDFDQTDGFSSEFPWYLEDTDTAWSILDLGKEIIFGQKVEATHPVPPAAPWRLLHEAKGAILKPKLYKRHTKLYREKKMRILRKSHYAYLLSYLLLLLSIVCSSFLIVGLGLFTCVALLHAFKMFYKTHFSFKELVHTLFYTWISPMVIFFQTLRGAAIEGCSLKETFFLLKP